MFPEYTSIYGNAVTTGLTYAIYAKFWMAEGVYRYWYKEGQPVLGITIIFHPWDEGIDQPLLVVGSIAYQEISALNCKEQCEPWTLFRTATDWTPQPLQFNEIIQLSDPDESGKINELKSIVVPLLWIENIEDIKDLFTRIDIELSE